MAYGKRLLFEEQRELANGAIGANYVAIGSALNFPARSFKLDNTTDVDLQFSIDGVTDHFFMRTGSGWVEDITMNKQPDTPFFFGKGTILYVKHRGVAPGSGEVIFSVMYGKGD